MHRIPSFEPYLGDVVYATDVDRSVASATDAYAERVAARAGELAPAERRVAELLLDLGPAATLLSAAALAEQLKTSDATVVRTAKSLGYSGLAEMRRALAAYGDNPPIGERLRRTLEQTPGDELFAASIRDHLAAVESLTRSVSPQTFQRAVAVLADSDRIVWRGVGPSAHLAAYGQLITQRIGKPSAVLVHTGTSFADELLTLAPRDAIVVLAYGRLQAHVRVLLEHAEKLGIPVVLITDALGRKLDRAVHTTLQSGRGAPGLFASHGTTLIVIEALVLAIAAAHQDEAEANLARLNELRAALLGRRIDVDTP
jgi:DNA-binding MurR/RpiR family transcriptional regulator